MADIVISEFMDEAVVSDGFAGFDVLYDPDLVDDPDRLYRELSTARGLIVRNRTQVRGDLLIAAPALKVVGRLGVGLDNIDMAACRDRNIAVCPASGANDLSVAEYVITAALVLLRGAWFATPDVASGAWPRGRLMGREFAGHTLGLVGFGSIARQVALRALAMGVRVCAFDPFVDDADPAWQKVEKMTFEEILSTAEIVSLHVPLTAETKHLIAARELETMRDDAILINAARGGVVDELALAMALRAGQISGAALDVFENEPLTGEPAQNLAGIPNLILTPHIAGVTQESNLRVSQVTAENVLRHLRPDDG